MNNQTATAVTACHALAYQVPDMANGFIIGTHCGTLTITADEARQHPGMQETVEAILRARIPATDRISPLQDDRTAESAPETPSGLTDAQRDDLAMFYFTMDSETSTAMRRVDAMLKLLAGYAIDSRGTPDEIICGIEGAREILQTALARGGLA